jgi:hypothetical protein
MNPILLIRLLLSLKSYQKQISQEAQKFDQENQIKSPTTRKMAHVVLGGKIILTAMIFGELPIDILQLGGVAEKLGWMGVLLVSGVAIFGFLAMVSIQEKDDQRSKIQRQPSPITEQDQLENVVEFIPDPELIAKLQKK